MNVMGTCTAVDAEHICIKLRLSQFSIDSEWASVGSIAVCVNAQVLIVRLIEKFEGKQGHRASDRRHRVSMIPFL